MTSRNFHNAMKLARLMTLPMPTKGFYAHKHEHYRVNGAFDYSQSPDSKFNLAVAEFYF